MNTSKTTFLLWVCCWLFTATAFAEVVYLKSGKKFEGKVTEKTDNSITLEIAGVPVTFWNDEIEKIEEAQTSSQPPVGHSPLSEAQGERYVDTAAGFEIVGPKGWFQRLGEGALIYTRTREPNKVNLPQLIITEVTPPGSIKSGLDFANLVLPTYEENAESHQVVLKWLEKPHEVEINGITGARLVFESVSPTGESLTRMDCFFMKDDFILAVQGLDRSNSFQTHLKDFEEAMNSLKFFPAGTRQMVTRKTRLEEILATGQKQQRFYEHHNPHFSLSIPEGVHRKWYFLVLPDPQTPFYLVEDSGAKQGVPLVTSSIEPIPKEAVGISREEFFRQIAAAHEQWEKATIGASGEIRFVNKGSRLDIPGVEAFERVYESSHQGITYHNVYVFIDNFLFQASLSTKTQDFAQDDGDFMNIVKTLRTKPE